MIIQQGLSEHGSCFWWVCVCEIMFCLVIVISDRYDRLEPIVIQSLSGCMILRWATTYSKKTPDPEGGYQAAFDFISRYLSRVFYHK